jgi:hypothetical protein
MKVAQKRRNKKVSFDIKCESWIEEQLVWLAKKGLVVIEDAEKKELYDYWEEYKNQVITNNRRVMDEISKNRRGVKV